MFVFNKQKDIGQFKFRMKTTDRYSLIQELFLIRFSLSSLDRQWHPTDGLITFGKYSYSDHASYVRSVQCDFE